MSGYTGYREEGVERAASTKYKVDKMNPLYKKPSYTKKKAYIITDIHDKEIGVFTKDELCNLFSRSWDTLKRYLNKKTFQGFYNIKSK